MPMSHILSCDRCGVQWRWLQMTKKEPIPACPNLQCGQKEVSKELSAPRVSRGAAPTTSIPVPQTQAGREKLAYQMAEGMGFTNMKDNLREGEIAAPPAPETVVTAPNGRTQKIPMGFTGVGNTPEAISGAISSMVGGAGGPRINAPALNVLGGMKRH